MPDDLWFEDLDPLLEMWLWESWCQDQQDENDFAKAYAILSGSFTNPDMAHAMLKSENPDHSSSDEDFEEASRMVLADRDKKKKESPPKRRRKRRHRKRVID